MWNIIVDLYFVIAFIFCMHVFCHHWISEKVGNFKFLTNFVPKANMEYDLDSFYETTYFIDNFPFLLRPTKFENN